MNAKLRAPILALTAALALATAAGGGCATTYATVKGASPDVVWYAAKHDFNEALEVAVDYQSLPSTPESHKVVIRKYAKEGNDEIEAIDAEVKAGTITNDKYSAASGVLRRAALKLRQWSKE